MKTVSHAVESHFHLRYTNLTFLFNRKYFSSSENNFLCNKPNLKLVENNFCLVETCFYLPETLFHLVKIIFWTVGRMSPLWKYNPVKRK